MKTLDQAQAVSGLPGLATLPLIGLRELARMTKRGREEAQETISPRRAACCHRGCSRY